MISLHDRKALLVLGAVVVLVGAAIAVKTTMNFWNPTYSSIPAGTATGDAVTVVATGLDTPWEIALLPDGDFIVTERGGILRRIGQRPAKLTVDGAVEKGEGGLMGLALHPDFAKNHLIYLAFTTRNGLGNVVTRYVLDLDAWKLTEPKTIIGDIPANQFHDGGRIAFGPDGMLYVTTGDAGVEAEAQDRESLAGKILRVTPDGDVPSDNPFGTRIWSWGHRNPQGIAWDDKGTMWATEHGRSGPLTGYDEVNRIVKGGNYGWPRSQGDEALPGTIPPVAQSGPKETWAPAGIAFLNGKLYFAGLRGQSLFQADPVESAMSLTLRSFFKGEFGRLRAVTAAGGKLYVTTSNLDGRGSPKAGDDRILRIDPSAFVADARR